MTDSTILAPYSGEETPCPKCSNPEAFTKYQRAVGSHMLLRDDSAGTLQRGPLPERLRRECKRCEYSWDEALCPPDCGMTVEALAHAVDNATPYPVELPPEVCTYIARYLLGCLHVSARVDHLLWQYDAGRPDTGPAPQPETPPADRATTDGEGPA